MKGGNAERKGQWVKAAEAYRRAIELMESGGDALRVRRWNGRTPPMLGALKDRFKAMQERQKVR